MIDMEPEWDSESLPVKSGLKTKCVRSSTIHPTLRNNNLYGTFTREHYRFSHVYYCSGEIPVDFCKLLRCIVRETAEFT